MLNGDMFIDARQRKAYDAVGDRLSSVGLVSYNCNASSELTSTSAATFTYDNNGNTVSKTHSTGTTNYTWDFENRPSSVTLPGNGGTVNFLYDPFGRRIYKSSPAGTSVYVYDGDNIIQELKGAGSLVAQYTQGPGIDQPLALYQGAGPSYFHADGLGSIASLTDPTGALAASYVCDSFGKVTASTGTVVNPSEYTSREFDSETGLYYYRARYYDPISGRFLSEDPIGFEGGINFYRFVGDNPISFSDPLGLFSPQTDVTNNIKLIRSIDIDFACDDPQRGTQSGGACTVVRAYLNCTCTPCGQSWKAKANLRLSGTMYVNSGIWPYKGRNPADQRVHDEASAIAHEYSAHINPAIQGVTSSINHFESKPYDSKKACEAACKQENSFV